jgi:hypothetical protein
VNRRATLLAAAVLLHALAREVDRALGLLLQAEVEPAGFARELLRALAADGALAAARVVAWAAVLGAAWALLALERARRRACPLREAAAAEAPTLLPLLLRPALTLLALGSVALRPAFPYAFTLPVALTQDWGPAQDLAALAVVLALRAPAVRFPAPRPREVFVVAFLAYAAFVPDRAWRWEQHPGNEPKYLRQAVALGLGLTFDAEGVSAAMEELAPRPAADAVASAVATIGRESGRLAVAVATGAAGRDAIRATRITRQTIRGKEGGVYYVLAPGPSVLLAPALRLDRAINRWRGTPGRVAFAVLLWCALAAWLVAALQALLRDATGRAGLASALALGFAALPPFLFYFFQFYPEMLGALVLAVAFRAVALRPSALVARPWPLAWLLATLPWLHQKFLPVWAVLVATAVLASWRERRAARPIVALLVPQALSLCLFALYSFAVTGSVRPDALFLAWGPGGVTTARVGQGLLGLLFDARYGLVPYVPLLALAAAGPVAPGARRLALAAPAAVTYYLTVASADNWSGAVCNLGRYFMPVAPLAIALVGLALARAAAEDEEGPRRARVALALVLAAWSALFAVLLWSDPLAANDSGLLVAKSTFADGNQYVPNLFIRHWSDGAPGLWARVATWLALVLLAAAAVRRARSALRLLAGAAAVLLVAGFLLERWPTSRAAPTPPGVLAVDASTRVVFDGAARVRGEEAVLGPGEVTLLVRRIAADATPPGSLRAVVGGEGAFQAAGRPPFPLRATGGLVDLPLEPYHRVSGAAGRSAAFARATVTVSGQAVLRFPGAEGAVPSPAPTASRGGGGGPDEPE